MMVACGGNRLQQNKIHIKCQNFDLKREKAVDTWQEKKREPLGFGLF
jgi:hypothetical protein